MCNKYLDMEILLPQKICALKFLLMLSNFPPQRLSQLVLLLAIYEMTSPPPKKKVSVNKLFLPVL